MLTQAKRTSRRKRPRTFKHTPVPQPPPKRTRRADGTDWLWPMRRNSKDAARIDALIERYERGEV